MGVGRRRVVASVHHGGGKREGWDGGDIDEEWPYIYIPKPQCRVSDFLKVMRGSGTAMWIVQYIPYWYHCTRHGAIISDRELIYPIDDRKSVRQL